MTPLRRSSPHLRLVVSRRDKVLSWDRCASQPLDFSYHPHKIEEHPLMWLLGVAGVIAFFIAAVLL